MLAVLSQVPSIASSQITPGKLVSTNSSPGIGASFPSSSVMSTAAVSCAVVTSSNSGIDMAPSPDEIQPFSGSDVTTMLVGWTPVIVAVNASPRTVVVPGIRYSAPTITSHGATPASSQASWAPSLTDNRPSVVSPSWFKSSPFSIVARSEVVGIRSASSASTSQVSWALSVKSTVVSSERMAKARKSRFRPLPTNVGVSVGPT